MVRPGYMRVVCYKGATGGAVKIYVASSWRNRYQPNVVLLLNALGFEVYDFRHPDPTDKGFHWSEIDRDWANWTCPEYLEGLADPIAESGFKKDYEAMKSCEGFVLVCPAGRSAHLEFGWAIGAKKRTAIYLPEPQEPELMYKLADRICLDFSRLVDFFRGKQ